MRIFLTGANGYLGSLLAEQFDRMPEVESITGIGLRPARPNVPAKLKFQHLDIRTPEIATAMADHDVVVHTACVVLWPATMTAAHRDSVNYEGTRRVAEAARKNRVQRFIHASSMAVYDPVRARGQSNVTEEFPLGDGRSSYYYWNAKAEAERILTETLRGTDTFLTMLRPIYIIGPRNRKTAENYRNDAVNLRGYDPRRQFIHEDDVVSAFVLALQKDMPGSFNVTPDDCLRMSAVWNIVGAKSVRTVPLSIAKLVTWVRWRFMGFRLHPCWIADMLVDFTGSSAKLKAAGWTPRYNSEQALRSAL
ncbi:MAG: NAD-dependent epimerase/dehydratase family protein [Verrucomicrobia bacterium]|jgi:nucleoside-diphosphate-sugar epimerase|nr:NAD-dependent epimerase/dehydratase family protein [Verrucomicrobiota bacterium]